MKMPLKILPLAFVALVLLTVAPGSGEIRKPDNRDGPVGATMFAGHYNYQSWRRRRQPRNPQRYFMPPSVAAKRAQRVYGGKVLGVHLRGGIYYVKLRGEGRVWIVRVHAASGRIMGP